MSWNRLLIARSRFYAIEKKHSFSCFTIQIDFVVTILWMKTFKGRVESTEPCVFVFDDAIDTFRVSFTAFW